LSPPLKGSLERSGSNPSLSASQLSARNRNKVQFSKADYKGKPSGQLILEAF